MMLKRTAIVATLGLISTSACFADAFNPKAVPADAKWVVHVDVDALVKTPFWEIVEDRLNANPGTQSHLQEMENITGIIFPDNLHSVTLVGMGFDDADGIVILSAKANQEQLLSMLQTNPAYSNTPHENREIVSWEDKGKVMYGTFYSPDLIIIAQNKDNVIREIDTLIAKNPPVASSSLLTLPNNAGILAGVAGDSIAQLAARDKNNPVLKNLKSGWITATLKEANLVLNSTLDFGTAQTAQQMAKMAEGLKAAGMYMAANDNADPKIKALAPFLPGAQISTKDAAVQIEWVAPADSVKSLLMSVIQAKHPGQAAPQQ